MTPTGAPTGARGGHRRAPARVDLIGEVLDHGTALAPCVRSRGLLLALALVVDPRTRRWIGDARELRAVAGCSTDRAVGRVARRLAAVGAPVRDRPVCAVLDVACAASTTALLVPYLRGSAGGAAVIRGRDGELLERDVDELLEHRCADGWRDRDAAVPCLICRPWLRERRPPRADELDVARGRAAS